MNLSTNAQSDWGLINDIDTIKCWRMYTFASSCELTCHRWSWSCWELTHHSSWATVCKMVRPMLSDRCLSVCLSCPVLSCLSVTLMYCGQMVWRFKMKLGVQIGLGPGHIVLDGDPAPLPQRGTAPIFGPYLLRPNGCMDQDVTWYGGRPRPMRLCVRWGPQSPSPKAPQFSAHFYCGQTARWIKMPLGMEVGLSPGDFVLDGDPSPLPPKGGGAPSPIFGPCLLWPKGCM